MSTDRGAVPGDGSGQYTARAAGYTLIELMITLAVASLILFLALPAYQHILMKSYRSAGKGVLLDVLSRQEQYFANHKGYALGLGNLGLEEPYYVDAQAQPVPAAQAVYKVELVVEAETFLGVRAIPQNRQVDDHLCHTFTISSTGVRAVSGSSSDSPRDCWR